MKLVLTILLFVTIFLFSGCYTVSSLQEKPDELIEANHSNEDKSKDYFSEENYDVEIDSSYELAYADSLEEEESGFFENLITEIVYRLSNISNNDDNLIMIFSGDNVVYIVNSDNSSGTIENSSTKRNHSSTRNTSDRNYDGRK
ncbi:MAG: hypothetical protein OQJ93_09165 [Ignavibacteriaceae bacterium]|jgi:hypothetical protein|nr:hypothetical protein [Ignavibacteriaceae bacterium]MCW8817663.1 hypothetical protein [Ignavibacteriaceae bacterium]MCW8960432.1 hypothetical protein [Ignavibacteriaceae bacterium]MCW9095604.1 hypothetical protein [Ignavibacteriaceae bacterium]MCW9097547.1 hypothetical protein [Ignavibacteriaceae bacterium]